MKMIDSLIKWPGGKSREIKYIEHLIPNFDRYVEPFFGGGAMFFYLRPKYAIINDISSDLIDFYSLTKEQNSELESYLILYSRIFDSLLITCEEYYPEILSLYCAEKSENHSPKSLELLIENIITKLDQNALEFLILDLQAFKSELFTNFSSKMLRTIKNEARASFSKKDLQENLLTGFTSGLYMYFRSVYNDILLKRNTTVSKEYKIANFYFIREYCYGSMFRYNSRGEFNIPYGGMSYNRKNFRSKIGDIFCSETKDLFSNTDIYCQDFEDFLSSIELNENDFMFLDPPYDTDFSDYEGREFSKEDQKRLAEVLKKTKAKFILIIKYTDYIFSLYENTFNILFFDKTYTYNVRSRNDRNVEHLIITNMET